MKIRIRDPDLDQYQNNADRMRMLSQVLHMLEYWAIFFYIHNNASLQCYYFRISGNCVMILSILDSILKFSSKNNMCLDLLLNPPPSGSAFTGCRTRSGSVKMMRIRNGSGVKGEVWIRTRAENNNPQEIKRK
jgi:hypothetical protein